MTTQGTHEMEVNDTPSAALTPTRKRVSMSSAGVMRVTDDMGVTTVVGGGGGGGSLPFVQVAANQIILPGNTYQPTVAGLTFTLPAGNDGDTFAIWVTEPEMPLTITANGAELVLDQRGVASPSIVLADAPNAGGVIYTWTFTPLFGGVWFTTDVVDFPVATHHAWLLQVPHAGGPLAAVIGRAYSVLADGVLTFPLNPYEGQRIAFIKDYTGAGPTLDTTGGPDLVNSVNPAITAPTEDLSAYGIRTVLEYAYKSSPAQWQLVSKFAANKALLFTTPLYAAPFVAEAGKINRVDGTVVGLAIALPPGVDGDVIVFANEGSGGSMVVTSDVGGPDFIFVPGNPFIGINQPAIGVSIRHSFTFNGATKVWIAQDVFLQALSANSRFVPTSSFAGRPLGAAMLDNSLLASPGVGNDIGPIVIGDGEFAGRSIGGDLGSVTPAQAAAILALFDAPQGDVSAAMLLLNLNLGYNMGVTLTQAGHNAVFQFLTTAGTRGLIRVVNPNALFSITTWTVGGGVVKFAGAVLPTFGVGVALLEWFYDGQDVYVWTAGLLFA